MIVFAWHNCLAVSWANWCCAHEFQDVVRGVTFLDLSSKALPAAIFSSRYWSGILRSWYHWKWYFLSECSGLGSSWEDSPLVGWVQVLLKNIWAFKQSEQARGVSLLCAGFAGVDLSWSSLSASSVWLGESFVLDALVLCFKMLQFARKCNFREKVWLRAAVAQNGGCSKVCNAKFWMNVQRSYKSEWMSLTLQNTCAICTTCSVLVHCSKFVRTLNQHLLDALLTSCFCGQHSFRPGRRH